MTTMPKPESATGNPEAVVFVNIQIGKMTYLEFQDWLSDMRDASYQQGIEIGQESMVKASFNI